MILENCEDLILGNKIDIHVHVLVLFNHMAVSQLHIHVHNHVLYIHMYNTVVYTCTCSLLYELGTCIIIIFITGTSRVCIPFTGTGFMDCF